MLRGKYIGLNNFNGDIMSYSIKEYQFDYKYTKYKKVELDKPKEFLHEKWIQWE